VNFNKVFVDANVILDLFVPDRPFADQSITAIEQLLDRNVQLFTSCDLITTVYYFLAKLDRQKAFKSIEAVTEIFDLVPFSNIELIEALSLMRKDRNFIDLEDTIQYVLARKAGCDLIITNDKAFFSPDVAVLTSEKLLEVLKGGKEWKH